METSRYASWMLIDVMYFRCRFHAKIWRNWLGDFESWSRWISPISLLVFGTVNRFEKNPLNPSCGNTSTTTPWDKSWFRKFCNPNCPWVTFGWIKRRKWWGRRVLNSNLYPIETTDWTYKPGWCITQTVTDIPRLLRVRLSIVKRALEKALWAKPCD